MLSCTFGEGETTRRDTTPEFPVALLGTWIQAFPREETPDTIRLLDKGIARGPAGHDGITTLQPLTRWWIDQRFMPGGLCLGDGKLGHCTAYVVRNDTLALATESRLFYVRLGSRAERAMLQRDTQDEPIPLVRPPRPGERGSAQ